MPLPFAFLAMSTVKAASWQLRAEVDSEFLEDRGFISVCAAPRSLLPSGHPENANLPPHFCPAPALAPAPQPSRYTPWSGQNTA